MKQYYGYIRVSTVKQGQHGVSLQEQKDAILRYSKRSDIEICDWFEEQETAAKQGRPVFNKMLKQLQARKAQGVVLHKIDRGARNLKDWASIAELTDKGIDVHLANDGLDIKSRGGRLSADIQAVIAADYIRNLREESLKGFYGRLKQGLLPMRAPIGYVDNGGGKVKTPHLIMAPLVAKAFKLYATGEYSFDTLVPILKQMGLRNHNNKPLRKNALTGVLNNIFYTGLIRVTNTGEIFKGIHVPIISQSLFDQVQAVIHGKTQTRIVKHEFLFRRLLRCGECHLALIGEKQKGHHYYRCHNRQCPMKCIREERIDTVVLGECRLLAINSGEERLLRHKIHEVRGNLQSEETKSRTGLKLRIAQINDRLNRLTDALIDGTIDRDSFTTRKNALLLDQRSAEEELDTVMENTRFLPDRLENILELLKTLPAQYEIGIPVEKRRVLNLLTSNLSASKENVCISMRYPYGGIAKMRQDTEGCPERNVPRIWDLMYSAAQNKDISIEPCNKSDTDLLVELCPPASNES